MRVITLSLLFLCVVLLASATIPVVNPVHGHPVLVMDVAPNNGTGVDFIAAGVVRGTPAQVAAGDVPMPIVGADNVNVPLIGGPVTLLPTAVPGINAYVNLVCNALLRSLTLCFVKSVVFILLLHHARRITF